MGSEWRRALETAMTIDKRAPRLAYLVTGDRYFLSRRLSLARAAKAG
jgi:hypothetical protein